MLSTLELATRICGAIMALKCYVIIIIIIVESPKAAEISGILAKSQDHRTPAPNTCHFPVAWVDRS